MVNQQFLLRTAQSIAREYVPRSDANRIGAAILEMALTNWDEVRAHYPPFCDDIAVIERFAADILDTPATRDLLTHAA